MNTLNQLITRYPILSPCVDTIEDTFNMLQTLFRDGGKLLLCGNGGSAADAEHWSGELLKQFVKKRVMPDETRQALGDELADQLQPALPVIPFTGFTSLETAFANDCDSTYTYAQLVYALGKKGDALVGISTSGNAKNVCHALKTARALGLKTIGLTGATGGAMKALCDVCICVPENETFIVQELHLPVYHALCIMLEDALF